MKKKVTWYALNPHSTMEFYTSKLDRKALVAKLFADGHYTACWSYITDDVSSGEVIAEELFDLTNNPSRQEERERTYGNGRSLSVGDVVDVNENGYLCDSIGWVEI